MSDTASFQELIRRIRAGDQDAATQLVRQYEPTIRRAVRFRLNDPALKKHLDSMDICQSVMASFFVRAASGQYELEEPEQLLKLLVSMARNKLTSHARKQYAQRRDQRRVFSNTDYEDQITDLDGTPSQQISAKELLEEAHRCMSPEEIELMQLRREGANWSEIAERLGGTSDSLRMKLVRAIGRISQKLGLDESR